MKVFPNDLLFSIIYLIFFLILTASVSPSLYGREISMTWPVIGTVLSITNGVDTENEERPAPFVA